MYDIRHNDIYTVYMYAIYYAGEGLAHVGLHPYLVLSYKS